MTATKLVTALRDLYIGRDREAEAAMRQRLEDEKAARIAERQANPRLSPERQAYIREYMREYRAGVRRRAS